MAATKGFDWAVESLRVVCLRKSGMSSVAVAKQYGLSVHTLRQSVRKHGYSLNICVQKQVSPEKARRRAINKAARYARKLAADERAERQKKSKFSGLIPFSVIRRIDRLIADGWEFPDAYRAIVASS